MAGKGKRISKCGGGWTPSVGLSPPLLSLTQLLLTAKRFAPRAKITDHELSCRQMQPTRTVPKTGVVQVGPAWTIGYGLESVRCTLESILLWQHTRLAQVQGPGSSRPEDFGKHLPTSSFGGSFDFLAFGPRWRQESAPSGGPR